MSDTPTDFTRIICVDCHETAMETGRIDALCPRHTPPPDHDSFLALRRSGLAAGKAALEKRRRKGGAA